MAHKKLPVRTQMDSKAPSMTGGKGRYGSSPAPFDAPQSMGGGGIPTKFYDEDLPLKKAKTINSGRFGTNDK